MTQDNFEAKCAEICPHCREGSIPRWRFDSNEWVHDWTFPIAGTLGKRQGHAFCAASDFRKQWKDKLVGQS